ncbi:ATP-dependent DNA helicase DinG [Neobacillus sedimentimangrovi]|uniref:ATP-dependent DNA helicase DinG n=1 Tax=Neobacillus sedimentimangrovi TaxID=2699460 RepID=UPI0013D534E2|nr:ATP-dependent DNA helicase DinG [Neobacillus sedimentimangrovi]
MSNKFVVVDLETTGNLPKKGDRIIQFAAVVIENGEITERFSSLVNPQKPIPVFIEELTGINDEMVKNAPIFSEIAPKIMDLLEGAYFVAHNILFDLSFLQEELIRAGYEGFFGPVLDTVEMARILFPTSDSYKLSDLAVKENLHHDRPHQADSDAEVTAELFLILLRKLSNLPMITLRQLLPLSGGLKSDLQLFLEELLETLVDREDVLSDSVEIFQGLALRKTAIKTETKSSPENQPYPENEGAKVKFLENGMDGFEKRIRQFEMMDAVYYTFQNEKHTLIEAGTGVGKSLGYLFPAAYIAKNHNRPIVISTHTIQQQEQILKKEIPLLNKILPFNIKAILLKGRSHYINLERFLQVLQEENDNYDIILTKMQILVWLTETETGEKDELNLSSGGLLFWNKIKNDPAFSSTHQEWREWDFYLKSIKEANKADLIITNHSLLLSDIKNQGSILPNYDLVVIDEGHHLEKVAAQYFGFSLDFLSTRMLLSQFGTFDQKGLLNELEEMVRSIPDRNDTLLHPFEINQMVIDLSYEVDEFFKLLAYFAKNKKNDSNGSYRLKIRFSPLDKSKDSKAVLHSAERCTFLIKDLYNAINSRLFWINQQKSSLSDLEERKVEEIYQFLNELNELREALIHCFIRESNDVKWIEVDVRTPQNVTTFMAQPASVAANLREEFFNKKKGVVITSATLTVNKSFNYLINELGLDPNHTLKWIIPSPFEYKRQVRMIIPDDLPDINSVTTDEYVFAIAENIITIAEATKGRMLILFTAFEMLKKTYDLIKESGFLDDYVLIAQGITAGSRTRLTRNFQRYDKAILLGTSSFWEGVDIPGEDLSCLVIVRLPFTPPDEPLTEAKCQLIEKRGGNPFYEYSLPEAVLRFKQGFGRLIRTEKDRGIVVVFDKRIISSKYGKCFLNSIPPIPIKKGKIDELVRLIQSWL